MSDDLAFTHAYCRACREITPAITVELPGLDGSGRFKGVDLLCGDCRLVITTLNAEINRA